MRYVLVLLLAGCAAPQQYRWVHDRGADRAQLNRDYAQCEAQALGQHPLMPVQQGLHIFAACLRGRGWSMVPL